MLVEIQPYNTSGLMNRYFSESKEDLKRKIADGLRIISSQYDIVFDPDSITRDTSYNKASVLSTIKNYLISDDTISDSSYKTVVSKFEERFKNISEIEYSDIITNLDYSLLDNVPDGSSLSEYIAWTEFCEKIIEYKDAFIEIFTLKKISNLLSNLVAEIYKKLEGAYRTCPLKLSALSYLDLLFSLKKDDSLILKINKGIINKIFFNYENKYEPIYYSPSVLNRAERKQCAFKRKTK